ncbi:MAG: gamma-glutamylcyclotransferase [Marinobacter sp.]|nr:gamma-glutamylcyclotransferase [Marinobacter sp.]
MHHVAVYGSLKRKQCNHHWLQGACYLGQDWLRSITLYDLGPYPAARLEPSRGILVEVYGVSAHQLARLDRLEDYRAHAPALGEYDRVQVSTRFGIAWLYCYNRPVRGHPRLRHGSWRR